MEQNIPSKQKLILLTAVAFFVAIGSIIFVLLHHEDGDDRVTFSLQDTSGNSVTETSLKGKWSILVFGFTSCPDICPTQANTVANALKLLDSERPTDSVQAIFISVDYLRDNALRLEKYLSFFHPEFVGYLGTELQLDLAIDSFQAVYSVTKDSSGIEVTHSSTIYLIDPNGRIANQFPFNTSSQELAGVLERSI